MQMQDVLDSNIRVRDLFDAEIKRVAEEGEERFVVVLVDDTTFVDGKTYPDMDTAFGSGLRYQRTPDLDGAHKWATRELAEKVSDSFREETAVMTERAWYIARRMDTEDAIKTIQDFVSKAS